MFKGSHTDRKWVIRETTPAVKIKYALSVISYRNKNIWLPNGNAATTGFVSDIKNNRDYVSFNTMQMQGILWCVNWVCYSLQPNYGPTAFQFCKPSGLIITWGLTKRLHNSRQQLPDHIISVVITEAQNKVLYQHINFINTFSFYITY